MSYEGHNMHSDARRDLYYEYNPDYEKNNSFDVNLYMERESSQLEGIKDDPILFSIVQQAHRKDMIKPPRHFRGSMRRFLALQEIFSIDRINTAEDSYKKGIVSPVDNIRCASQYLSDNDYSRPLCPRGSEYIREIMLDRSFLFADDRLKIMSRNVQPINEDDITEFALLRMFSYSLPFLNNLIDEHESLLEDEASWKDCTKRIVSKAFIQGFVQYIENETITVSYSKLPKCLDYLINKMF